MLAEQLAAGLIWSTAGVLQLSFAAAYLRRRGGIAPASYVIGFAIFLPFLGAVTAFRTAIPGCGAVGIYGSAFSSAVYCAIFLLMAAVWAKPLSTSRWLEAAGRIPDSWIIGVVCFWALAKIYLFNRYGLLSLSVFQYAFVESGGQYLYVETIVDSLARIFIIGGVLAVALRTASGIKSNWWVYGVVGVAFLAHLLLGEAAAGTRRTILGLAIVYLVTRWAGGHRGSLLREALVGVAVTAAVIVYYPLVRINLWNPDTQEQLLSGRVAEVGQGIGLLFMPNWDAIEEGAAVFVRTGPMEFLCQVSERQWEGGQLTNGAVTAAVIYNAIPRVWLENKTYREPDELLAEAYDLYPGEDYVVLDLATSFLAQLQSDFGPVGWAIASAAHLLTLAFVAWVFTYSLFGVLTKVTALGTAFGLLVAMEATLTTLISSGRDLLLFATVFESVRQLSKWLSQRTRRAE